MKQCLQSVNHEQFPIQIYISWIVIPEFILYILSFCFLYDTGPKKQQLHIKNSNEIW